MRPARLAEPPHQRGVARLEKDQHRVEPRHLAQPAKTFGNDDRKFALADVDDDRDLVDVAAARSDSFASVGMSVVGRLSTQK